VHELLLVIAIAVLRLQSEIVDGFSVGHPTQTILSLVLKLDLLPPLFLSAFLLAGILGGSGH
jgi:hypothetical protein